MRDWAALVSVSAGGRNGRMCDSPSNSPTSKMASCPWMPLMILKGVLNVQSLVSDFVRNSCPLPFGGHASPDVGVSLGHAMLAAFQDVNYKRVNVMMSCL